jgi:hypothetical protein
MASKLLPGKEARLKAQKMFGRAKQSEIEALGEKNKALATARSKTERLRSLRLAKEAADRAQDAADKAATDTKASSKKRPARSAPQDD